jgi:hypothetical protein
MISSEFGTPKEFLKGFNPAGQQQLSMPHRPAVLARHTCAGLASNLLQQRHIYVLCCASVLLVDLRITLLTASASAVP